MNNYINDLIDNEIIGCIHCSGDGDKIKCPYCCIHLFNSNHCNNCEHYEYCSNKEKERFKNK